MPETGPRSTRSQRTRPVAEVPPATGAEDTRRPLCSVAFCPICAAVVAAQAAAPDAVEHMLNAAREFLLAARAIVDARADDLTGNARGKETLERIEIA